MTRATILVIEDDRHRVPELQERLTSAGYTVLRMPLTGPEAIGEVAAMAPDLVLMDIAIRGRTDGVQAADLIQSNLDIPVIYIMPKDAYGQLTLQRARATGPFGYIFDPQDMRQLCSTIEVALLRNGLEREIKEGRQWLSTVLHSIGDGVVAVDERGLVTFVNPIAEAMTGWEAAEAVGKPLLETICIQEESTRGMISAVVSGGGNRTGADIQAGMHATLTTRRGHAIPVEVTISPIRGSEHKVKGMVLVFRDVTERRRAVQEIQRQANRAEALVEVASQLNRQIELGALLETVCVTTNRTLMATGTAVFLLDPRTDRFQIRAAYSELPLLQALEGGTFELPRDKLQSLISRSRPVAVLSELDGQPGLPYADLLSQLRLKTLVIAALFLRDELKGTLISVFSGDRGVVSQDDLELLRGLADQASTAIENAELFEQVRTGRERQQSLARSLVEIQEAERRRVAWELHDQLGQALTGLQFMLEVAKVRGQATEPGSLDEIQKYVGDIMEQTREMSLSLRPSMLDDLGLLPTLQWHFERYTRQTGIKIDFRNNGCNDRLASEIETAAYRIIQEALTNVARYAKVKRVSVGLDVRDDSLWLEVLDKGQGFDASTAPYKPSSGLGGMRERAALLGGILTVFARPRQGTQVIAARPLNGQVMERREYERKRSARG